MLRHDQRLLLLLLTFVVWSNPSQALESQRVLAAIPTARPSSPPPSSGPSTKRKKSSSWEKNRSPTRSPLQEPTRSPKIESKKTTSPTSAPKLSRPLFPGLDPEASLVGPRPDFSAKGRHADTMSPTSLTADDLPKEKVQEVYLEQQSVTFSVPLKAFELNVWRDPKWSSSFDDKHIQYTVEQFLAPSLNTDTMEGKNVTLKLQTVTCNQDTTECAYQFQGSYYYDVAINQVVDPGEIWIQQFKVMMDQTLLQAAFDKNPFMAVSQVRVVSVRFLDGSAPLNNNTGNHSDATNTTHLIVVAGCVGVVLISIIGTAAICFAFRNQREISLPEEPVKPLVPASKTSRTSRSTNPTATIVVYHTDAPSVTSSITEQRVKDDVADYASYAMSYTLDRSICETIDLDR